MSISIVTLDSKFRFPGTGSFNVTAGALNFSEGQTHTGWTAGAGLEYAVTDNVLVRGEYLYTDLGSRNYLSGAVAGGVDARLTSSTVRAGISFKF